MVASVLMGGILIGAAHPAHAEILLGLDAGWLRHTSHGDGYDYLEAGPRVGGQLGLASAKGFLARLDVAGTALTQSEQSGRAIAGGGALIEVIVLGGARLVRPNFIVDLCLGADWSFLHKGSRTTRTEPLPLPRAVVAVRRPFGLHHRLGAEISLTGLPGLDGFATIAALYEWGS